MKISFLIFILIILILGCSNINQKEDRKYEEIRYWNILSSFNSKADIFIDTIWKADLVLDSLELTLKTHDLNNFLNKLSADSIIEKYYMIDSLEYFMEAYKKLKFNNDLIGVLRITTPKEFGYITFYYCKEFGVLAKIKRRKLYVLDQIQKRNSDKIDLQALSSMVLQDSTLSRVPPLIIEK